MEVIAKRPEALASASFTYCPGCLHGVAHRLIAESMDELGIANDCIGICPVGCSVFGYRFFNCDFVSAAHGRAPAVATGIVRSRPSSVVFTYQGDGDLAAIGTAEIIHAANRGENITVFFINNAIYGMTGGQMAPTTLAGMKATTSPYGRDVDDVGEPIKVCELLDSLAAPVFIERVSLLDVPGIIGAKKAVKKALQYNKQKKGFSFVEMISTCPTNWGKDAVEAVQWAKESMLPVFPVGQIRDKGATK